MQRKIEDALAQKQNALRAFESSFRQVGRSIGRGFACFDSDLSFWLCQAQKAFENAVQQFQGEMDDLMTKLGEREEMYGALCSNKTKSDAAVNPTKQTRSGQDNTKGSPAKKKGPLQKMFGR